jgi:hypothetical protein
VRAVQRSKARPCALDLSTVRETLAYMHDDLRRAPGLERAAAALAAALAEVELAELGATALGRRRHPARFLPRACAPLIRRRQRGPKHARKRADC